MNSEPKPPTFSPKHRAEQISFQVRKIMADVKRHEIEIKRLQAEAQALIAQVKGWL
jgi:hypothetical protein